MISLAIARAMQSSRRYHTINKRLQLVLHI